MTVKNMRRNQIKDESQYTAHQRCSYEPLVCHGSSLNSGQN